MLAVPVIANTGRRGGDLEAADTDGRPTQVESHFYFQVGLSPPKRKSL